MSDNAERDKRMDGFIARLRADAERSRRWARIYHWCAVTMSGVSVLAAVIVLILR